MSRLKEEALIREQKQEEEYNKQVQHLTQEVLRAKREFEEHLQVSHAPTPTPVNIWLSLVAATHISNTQAMPQVSCQCTHKQHTSHATGVIVVHT